MAGRLVPQLLADVDSETACIAGSACSACGDMLLGDGGQLKQDLATRSITARYIQSVQTLHRAVHIRETDSGSACCACWIPCCQQRCREGPPRQLRWQPRAAAGQHAPDQGTPAPPHWLLPCACAC